MVKQETIFVFTLVICLYGSVSTASLDDGSSSKPETSPKCRENEVLTDCKRSCPPDTCDSHYYSYPCDVVESCSPGCVCAPGYLRTNSNDSGICVPEDKCLPVQCAQDPNAVRDCGNRCGKTCRDYNMADLNCSNDFCQESGCSCKEGFLYDENISKCVEPENCSPQLKCDGAHEIYSSCYDAICREKHCKDVGLPVPCPGLSRCVPGCLCEVGFVRNVDGDCIETDKCFDFKCSVNETQVGCDANCPSEYCPASDQWFPECNLPSPCLPGCNCKYNFKRDNNTGDCILASECPPIECTAQNEIYDACPSICLFEYCESREGPPLTCKTSVWDCQPKCVCKPDHFRNNEGVCVPQEQCPPIPECPTNQTHVSCNVNCPDSYCPMDDKPMPVCDAPFPCPSGCRCKTNYLIDNSTNNCILASECPAVKCSRQHEIFDSCPSACLAESCSDKDAPQATCDALIQNCRPRCVCEENHFRDDQGLCVPYDQCKPTN